MLWQDSVTKGLQGIAFTWTSWAKSHESCDSGQLCHLSPPSAAASYFRID